MLQRIIILAIVLDSHDAFFLDVDYDKPTVAVQTLEFEPVIPQTKYEEKISAIKNIDCDRFSDYALNCTLEAAFIYNSTKNTPPPPSKITEWCSAIRFRTSCALDWNTECREVTEKHFYDDNLKGHMHVVDKICDDTKFLAVLDVDYDKPTVAVQTLEFEPVIPQTKYEEKISAIKNIDCDRFSDYALNCTLEAAFIYNSTKNTPPPPSKITEWCSAIRFRTSCALDWNTECREVTEKHFYDDNLKGHMHVVDKICDDTKFLAAYSEAAYCIDIIVDVWESCYSTFKLLVDEQTNTSRAWTHYETHFFVCCARAQFRRCTLDALFEVPYKCPHEQAVTMQKFSVIVSEGDVFQDCDMNIMYPNCPGGDPRPTHHQLRRMINGDEELKVRSGSDASQKLSNLFLFILGFICEYYILK